jgi:hypothetical protein
MGFSDNPDVERAGDVGVDHIAVGDKYVFQSGNGDEKAPLEPIVEEQEEMNLSRS